jgi:hypothetical protein
MGLYGVAFSAGLTIAALLGALGAASSRWVAFWCTAGLAAAALVATWPVRQHGPMPFLTTFAVDEWGLRAAQAAALLAVGRVISILAKVLSGASSDRRGPIASARTTGRVVGATGVAWVLLPAGWPAYACAACSPAR